MGAAARKKKRKDQDSMVPTRPLSGGWVLDSKTTCSACRFTERKDSACSWEKTQQDSSLGRKPDSHRTLLKVKNNPYNVF